MPLAEQIRALMTAYLEKHKSIQSTSHRLGDGLSIRTQPAIQSNPYGKTKYATGCETVWLRIDVPRREPILIARLSETRAGGLEFENLAISAHETLVTQHLGALQEAVA